jgi:EAL domain-containing protein (putative c-di-GMP-specific phosphodiesterase class I)/DNA-binding NarL/FixJ family response regulator
MKTDEMNVLVLEDDDFQRRMVVNMLHSLGVISISEADNGKQALEHIRAVNSTPIDIALCDLNMPEMDGMEFLRHLALEDHNIAVIIVSAQDSKLLASVGSMTRMYGIKLLGTIEKPIMPEQLKELLAKYERSEAERHQPAEAKRFTLEQILQGIQSNQFEPFFQPKVDLKTGQLTGAEALARWVHPEHGVISPYSFVSLLEQSGNIDDLTFLILEKSAIACRSLHERGFTLTMSVNLSLASLDDSTLADKITRTVRKAGIEPQYIVLEITESAAMTNVAPALENLARLCMNGFSLSIDDYGTGYSSMQQLTRIPFSELKIDQSFVKDCADNKAMRIVVESSIDMAHKLRVKSVAEGVETKRDWDTLKSIGCDTVQGYFIAKPMDATAFGSFVASYKDLGASAIPQAIRDQGRESILVVEDDDFVRKIILRVLQDCGFTRITDVDSAESAIKVLDANAFDLIISDVNMHEMNGLEFVKMIRTGKTHAKPETRIVILTSFSNQEILGAALALDINGFLVKPIIPAVVDDKLAQAMSERLVLHPPMVYETVNTTLKSLSNTGNRLPDTRSGAAISLGNHSQRNSNEVQPMNHLMIPIQRLRPGMVLKEALHIADGSLLLSSGHTFTELSINRLNDLRVLLKINSIAVQEAPEANK